MPRRLDLLASATPAIARGGFGASYTEASENRKLSPTVPRVSGDNRVRFQAVGPFIDVTNTSIETTCNNACPFKTGGCSARSGLTKFRAERLDVAADALTALDIIQQEVSLIDAAYGGGPIPQDGALGGRDLRLHDGGDVGSEAGARLLAQAARRFKARGGGSVFTYTHWWREIPREAWGDAITVLASVEDPADIGAARARGYAVAIIDPEFSGHKKAYRIPGSNTIIIPCPYESGAGGIEVVGSRDRPRTCVECRLCIDRDLVAMNAAIAFKPHGPGAQQVTEKLNQLNREPTQAGPTPGDKRLEGRALAHSGERDVENDGGHE